MCELYPIYRSCFGISVRIAMVYIGILSIGQDCKSPLIKQVTGAVINAALKKTGVNVSVLPTSNLTKGSWHIKYEAVVENQDDGNDPEKNVPGEAVPGDAAPGATDPQDNKPGEADTGSDNLPELPAPANTTTTTTTEANPPLTIGQFVGQMNRNGLSMLAFAYIALGILLLAANFVNSAELALLYVVLSILTSLSALCLLVGVVSECARAQDDCLLASMDWLSSFLVTLFWFIYIFFWLFFAGVVNAFANGAP